MIEDQCRLKAVDEAGTALFLLTSVEWVEWDWIGAVHHPPAKMLRQAK
jgi:hypothetical protein